jgi:hypothetical protein
VLPALLEAIRHSGAANPEELLARLLGANRGDQAERDRTLRRQFANQVALAAGAGDAAPLRKRRSQHRQRGVTLKLADVYPSGSGPHEQVVRFWKKRCARLAARDSSWPKWLFPPPCWRWTPRCAAFSVRCSATCAKSLSVRLRLPADFRATLPAAGGAGGDSGQAAGAAGPHRQPARLPGRRLVSVPLGRRPVDRSQNHGGGRGDGLRAVGRAVVQVQLAQPRTGNEIHRSLCRGAGADRAA